MLITTHNTYSLESYYSFTLSAVLDLNSQIVTNFYSAKFVVIIVKIDNINLIVGQTDHG